MIDTVARAAWRVCFPRPAEAAWRHAVRTARSSPRRAPGTIRLLDYDIAFSDATSLAPQWHDIFVRESLAFNSRCRAPRILDCGANLGLASLYFKRRDSEARITAFEPDPVIAPLLRMNLAQNGGGDIEVVEAAVWSTRDRLSFFSDHADAGALAATETPHGARERTPTTVDSVRLREWLVREEIDLLKLDIEGAELTVLQDVESALGSVAAIHLEVHDLNPARRLLPECASILDRAGFVTALGGVLPATWRSWPQSHSPFPGAVPGWITTIRAWREPS
jgi:FkbM family methyltransferase